MPLLGNSLTEGQHLQIKIRKTPKTKKKKEKKAINKAIKNEKMH